MTEEVENLILQHLRHMREQLSRVELDVADIKIRVSSIEAATAHLMANDAGQSSRIDRLERRILRVEQRLELQDQ
jgi:phage shock protein A